MGWIGYHLTVGKKKDGNEEKRETETACGFKPPRPTENSLRNSIKTRYSVYVYLCVCLFFLLPRFGDIK